MNRSIIDVLEKIIGCLQWYIDEDDVNVNDPENSYWITGQERAIYAMANVHPLLEDIKQALVDAGRYRWIKDQKSLTLTTEYQYSAPWTNVETGYQYHPSHRLAVNGMGINGIEHLDDVIDLAMTYYPLKTEVTQ